MANAIVKGMLDLNSKELQTLEGHTDESSQILKLNISNNLLTNLKGIESCTALSWLNASHNQIDSIKHLKKLINLNVLNLGYNKVKSTTHIGKLKELKALVLNNNELSSMDGLRNLKNLNTLVCSHNKLSEIDVTNLTNMVKLSAAHNQFKEMPNLTFQKELKEVRLNDNLISEIPEWMSTCKRLKILDIGNNKLEDFENLKLLSKLPFLENLTLRGNPVCSTEEFYIKVKLAFPNLRICDGKKLQDLYFKALEDKEKTKQISQENDDSSDEEQKDDDTKKNDSTKKKLCDSDPPVLSTDSESEKTVIDRGFKSKTKANSNVEEKEPTKRKRKRKPKEDTKQISLDDNDQVPQENSPSVDCFDKANDDQLPKITKKKKKKQDKTMDSKENEIFVNDKSISREIQETHLQKDKKRPSEQHLDQVSLKKKKKKKKKTIDEKFQRSGVVSVKSVKRIHKSKQTAVDVLLAASIDKASKIGLGTLGEGSNW